MSGPPPSRRPRRRRRRGQPGRHLAHLADQRRFRDVHRLVPTRRPAAPVDGPQTGLPLRDPPIGLFCGGPGIAARPPPDPPIGYCSSRLRSCTASKIQPALAWIRRCSRVPRHRGSLQPVRCIAGKGGFSGAGARRSRGRSRRSRSYRPAAPPRRGCLRRERARQSVWSY